MRRKRIAVALVWIILFVYVQSLAKDHSPQHTSNIKVKSHAQFDGNDIACWMSNNGKIVDNDITGNSAMEWPKGSGKHVDYASGLWLIGMDEEGVLRSACAEYASEYVPGTMNDVGVPTNPEDSRFRIYKINSDGSGDWDVWPFNDGAPALPAQDGSDSLDANGFKIPYLLGDQTLWYVMNDADTTQHANLFETLPLGVEVQVLAFGFDYAGHLSNTIFYEWTIKNKSKHDYQECYIGIWDDPDLGDASDDLIGCDPALNLAYVYNGRPTDAVYNFFVPAFGLQLLQGPWSSTGSSYMDMTGLSFFWGGAPTPVGDPTCAEEAYNFLKGFLSDGTPVLRPNGDPTPFWFDGDPVTGEGWIDNTPADRRMILSSGPFDLKRGETQVIRAAKIIAVGDNYLNSITELEDACAVTKSVHDKLFYNRSTAMPLVWLSFEKAGPNVVVSWSPVDLFFDDPNTHFLGYKLFQVRDEERIEIAAFDAQDGITEVRDIVDGEEMVVYSGTENGIETSFLVEHDAFSGNALQDGFRYYFSIQAYFFNKNAPSGEKLLTNDSETMVYRHLENDYDGRYNARHTQGHGDGAIEVFIFEPELLTGHRYEISFSGDRADWSMTMTVTDKDLNHIIYSGAIVDIRFDSLGFELSPYDPFGKMEWQASQDRWITGVNWGGAFFFGGMDLGYNFFGSTLSPDSLVPLHIEFQDAAQVAESGYSSKGAVYRRDLSYAHAGSGDLPLAAFDVTDPASPRRVNICFVEDATIAPANYIWDLGWYGSAVPDELGAREYLFFMKSDYDEGMSYNDDNRGTEADVLYAMWPTIKSQHSYLEAPFDFDIYISKGITPQDVFVFDATLTHSTKTLTEVPHTTRLFQNYPNPFNASTTFHFQLHTDARVDLDVYDVLGRHITSLIREDKKPGEYRVLWHAKNVPSGLYFVRLQVDGSAVRTTKVMLVK